MSVGALLVGARSPDRAATRAAPTPAIVLALMFIVILRCLPVYPVVVAREIPAVANPLLFTMSNAFEPRPIRRAAVLQDARPRHELHGCGAVLDGASCFRSVFLRNPRTGAMRFCLAAPRSIGGASY